MVFGSVFEVSFRASAVFLCFLDRNNRRYRRYMTFYYTINSSWFFASAFLSMLKGRNISLPITYFQFSSESSFFISSISGSDCRNLSSISFAVL